MYENATIVRVRPGTTADALRVLRESIAPVLKAQRGLLGLALMPAESLDQITVLSVWASEAHALAVEAQCAYRQQMCLLDPYVVAEPWQGAYTGARPSRRHWLS